LNINKGVGVWPLLFKIYLGHSSIRLLPLRTSSLFLFSLNAWRHDCELLNFTLANFFLTKVTSTMSSLLSNRFLISSISVPSGIWPSHRDTTGFSFALFSLLFHSFDGLILHDSFNLTWIILTIFHCVINVLVFHFFAN